jgi:hypothetical protein
MFAHFPGIACLTILNSSLRDLVSASEEGYLLCFSGLSIP